MFALITPIDDCAAHPVDAWAEYGNPRRNESALILFSSDHGEMIGDHHLFWKSHGYEVSARVAFFLCGKNLLIPWGVEDRLVCWEDIAPTLLDLAGVETAWWIDGCSLGGLVRSEPVKARSHLSGECGTGGRARRKVWLVADRWKSIWYLGDAGGTVV